MDQGIAPVTVVAYTLALAVGVIVFLFASAWLMARYLAIKTRGTSELARRVIELEAQRRGPAPRWRRWRFLVGPITLCLMLVTLATGHGALALPIVLIALPIGAIVYGLEIREVGYVTLSLPLQPTRLLEGQEAIRVGNLYVIGGLILFFACLILAIVPALVGLLVTSGAP
jgi:hypothetical protein